MTAPLFRYTGGKRRAAAAAWRALGDVGSYAEPFAGSAAVLLARPAWHLAGGKRLEILNDISGRITNMYRAIREDPEGVWAHCHGPRAELDVDARLAALAAAGPRLDEQLRADPAWHDTRLAGWQLYALRYVIYPARAFGAAASGKTGPPTRDGPSLTRADIVSVMRRLATGHVMLLCGGWERAVTEPMLFHAQTRAAGIFLDPPYLSPDWTDGLYGPYGDRAAGAAARAWAAERGADPRYRIVLAGFAGEGSPAPGWTEVQWASRAGGESRFSERLWLSPHCLLSATAGAALTADPRPVRWEHPAAAGEA